MKPADKLRLLRSWTTLSQSDMAKRINRSQSCYAQLEHGIIPLTQEHAGKIATILSVSMAWLTDESTDKPISFNKPEGINYCVLPPTDLKFATKRLHNRKCGEIKNEIEKSFADFIKETGDGTCFTLKINQEIKYYMFGIKGMLNCSHDRNQHLIIRSTDESISATLDEAIIKAELSKSDVDMSTVGKAPTRMGNNENAGVQSILWSSNRFREDFTRVTNKVLDAYRNDSTAGHYAVEGAAIDRICNEMIRCNITISKVAKALLERNKGDLVHPA